MPVICPKCGLPKDICACEALQKEDVQRISIYTKAKKFGKLITFVDGIESEHIEKTAKELKHKLACGGTFKDGHIELQGDHKFKVKNHLVSLGYPAENITVR
ncbi:MAG: stress response translation initiation inhibitor YciH [Candidatus Micrarchaeota archaeon]|nr:stress response translation initiation inhibitor YciH [Candidatus Micrarchaeota archaeon]